MDVIEAGDVVEKPSPDVFRSSRQFLDSEVKLIEEIKHNFLDTVGYMEFRKFSRKHQGVFRDVARVWTLILLVLCGFFSNLLFFSSCPNLGEIAKHGLFYKGYNLIILCVEIGMIVTTSFWLLMTQFQTGVVYSFRLSVLYTAVTFLLFILRTTISDSKSSAILHKCDYTLSNGEVLVYNIIPLIYISLQFLISFVSFFYSKLRPIIAVYYFKHPWFLKSWKFVNIEPVELKLLSFGKRFDGSRNISPRNTSSKCCEKSESEDKTSSENMKEGYSSDTKMFWDTQSDNQNIRLASGYFIEIKRFSVRKLLKKLNPIRLDLLLTFRTRKDRGRRPNSLKNQGCSINSWYLGEVNEEGRPHGFGRWREDDYYGEILVGFWKNGHPVGPFKTRECRSGSGFICLKLGFCRTEANLTPNLYGYADIECSVSGQFFRGFPLCHIYPAPSLGMNRSGSIFARIGAKGKAALDDTTQKGKKMVGALFNSSWFKKMRKKDKDKKTEKEKENTLDSKKVVRLDLDNIEGNTDKMESNELNSLSIDIPSGNEQNLKEVEPKLSSGMCKSEMNLSLQKKGVHMIRKVRQKLRRNQNRQDKERDLSLLWVFQNLSPHIPMFTIHPKNEVTILVDAERGLYIAGYFPVSEVLRYTKQTGARLALNNQDPESLLSENNLKSTILGPNDAISGLIPFSTSFSSSSIIKASQYPLNRPQDNRYLESVEVRVVDRYCNDSVFSKDVLDENQDNTVYYPELEVKNWIHSDGLHAAEVLIFIHGYNNTIMDALRQVGQMIAFGNFPSYIKPMVFSWPSGNSFLEYFKARKSAESPHTHNSLYQLILGLRNRGIRHIHIMTHSMGTRLFIQSFPKLLSENLLERCEQHDHRSSIDPGNYLGLRHSETQFGDEINPTINEKVQIVSMTFLNPDYYLDDFINKAFPMLRQYCNLITMYGDSQDGALKWSEIIQGRKALGCNVFGLHYGDFGSFSKRIKSQINDLDQYRASDVELTGGLKKTVSTSNMAVYEYEVNFSSNQKIGATEPKFDTENHSNSENIASQESKPRNDSALSLIYPSKVLINSFNASKSPKQGSPRASSSGILETSSPYANRHTPEQRFNYLDMDVIDQSFIEQNVGTMRHNNWNLNREVIEDLRELVVSRKRAYQRSTRLDKREGNVWVYRIAPSCVTSIFD
ncbi:Alpha/beta hydrolase family protein [Cryptosporidium meleagridis]|uniref:Alpha/beta hydrolase family protein n=1 Tax=Cryptosporidium meleagridis TaxID=93969 RepID=A0A2P4Z300_9CRYT|nr:Alpha/beta hydrolase family protein [Cryptosporidium meleagridis]